MTTTRAMSIPVDIAWLHELAAGNRRLGHNLKAAQYERAARELATSKSAK